MDFANFDTKTKSDEGVWLPIYAPDGSAVIAEFKIAGRDSKILKRRQQEIAKKSKNKKKITAAEEEQDTIDTIAICTLDWRMLDEDGNKGKDGVVVVDGKEIEISFDNAKTFYQSWNFVAEQVVEYIADRTYFLQN